MSRKGFFRASLLLYLRWRPQTLAFVQGRQTWPSLVSRAGQSSQLGIRARAGPRHCIGFAGLKRLKHWGNRGLGEAIRST